MKIALLHDSVLPTRTYGGIERVVVSLAQEYKRLGHQVVVACRNGSRVEGAEIFNLPHGYQSRDPLSWLPKGVDFLHAHQPLAVKPSLPFLVTIHGNGHPNEKYWRNTSFLSQSHARNHGAKYFVYNGVDTQLYPFVEKKEDYFVFLARASWRVKNLRSCIDFANELNVRLEVMGGSGVPSKNVRYHGSIGEADGKIEILSRAKALLYPTNWDEPFGLAPLEALACGTPVIASVNGAMPEVVRKGCGVLCETFEQFVCAPRQLSSITARDCRDVAEKEFGVDRMAKGYLALMEKIIANGELDQDPHYAFRPESISYIYKPNPMNRFRHMVMGRV
jgi:glycosyltransferase involved in cell wall biosynthesis